MGLNETALAERVHIGIFGLRNVGKSSIINALTNQDIAVVSNIAGTTTDPVKKTMELLPLGPVVIIDTPGIDDIGELGEMRVKKARQVLNYTDIALLVTDAEKELDERSKELVHSFETKNIPYIIVYNKADLLEKIPDETDNTVYVSAKTKLNIDKLKEMIAHIFKEKESERSLLADLISKNDVVVLVIPIDSSAPKGRLILPQQQTIREILEIGATVVACKDTELVKTLAGISKKPKLIITDSQVFGKVVNNVPEDILLTSFSILFARYKGNLTELVNGANQLNHIKDGDTILISEGCTHHRQCEDIGTVKIPNWINKYTGKEVNFEFSSGTDFPEELSKYSLIVHCGGCMLNSREMHYRLGHAKDQKVPITNYGVAIAQMHGILKRSIEPFPDVLKIFEGKNKEND